MTPVRVWVKVCGLCREPDVVAAIRAGADAVGFVLTSRSPRALRADRVAVLARLAREEAARWGREVSVVGVFSGEDADRIRALAVESGVDVVQLHGGEGEDVRRALEAAGLRRTIRAVWPTSPPRAHTDGVSGDEEIPPPPAGPWAVLLDSRTPHQAGGTGRRLDPDLAASWTAHLARMGLRAILAGGLRPDNVAEALASARPWGVDVSSGVEVPGRPGEKDPGAVAAFVRAVRAWEEGFRGRPA